MSNLTEIIDKVKVQVERIYEENWGKYPTSHDMLHILRVCNLAMIIALNENIGERELHLLKLACLLHDIALPMKGCKQDHASESAKIAKKLLENYKLNSNEIELICNAIREHSWTSKKRPSTIISAILQDADRLDALGVVGFARMICYGEYMKRKLHHPLEVMPKKRRVDDEAYTLDHVFAKLVKLPKSMNTKTGRKIANKRLKKLLSLIEDFESEITSCST
ncbi:MAG: HD domain-containing protein [archaeon GB-1867-005]|nr:HD domain-containing protein [Candidatus Culexmicrobium cathedralense]